MYDGLNQAIKVATGDIIAILNSDDFYVTPDTVARMVQLMQDTEAQVGWGDINYVDRNDKRKVVRRWRSSPYSQGKFRKGWQPPHPAFFVRKEVYEKYGLFRMDMRVSADYELMLRFLERYRVSSCYLNRTLVIMRVGGASGSPLGRLWAIRKEDAHAWKVNNLPGGFLAAWVLKPISKISQLFK
jgi:GT2 family glycosyltransferase